MSHLTPTLSCPFPKLYEDTRAHSKLFYLTPFLYSSQQESLTILGILLWIFFLSCTINLTNFLPTHHQTNPIIILSFHIKNCSELDIITFHLRYFFNKQYRLLKKPFSTLKYFGRDYYHVMSCITYRTCTSFEYLYLTLSTLRVLGLTQRGPHCRETLTWIHVTSNYHNVQTPLGRLRQIRMFRNQRTGHPNVNISPAVRM